MIHEDAVSIRVTPFAYSDEIHVLIPPKYWGNYALPEGIRRAIVLTFGKEPGAGGIPILERPDVIEAPCKRKRARRKKTRRKPR